ncbi:hypothetical protein F2Q70_00022517 [Brassica cretica]|uniref:Uncharacterized protein n=1 Tax=Brassica cretica TaxID=69181 RepID=A0A8S9GV24_BRACR|nr:hypothetical protein F2Q70_00022517 [Brassica cretica]
MEMNTDEVLCRLCHRRRIFSAAYEKRDSEINQKGTQQRLLLCMISRHTRRNSQGELVTLTNQELARLERTNRQQSRQTDTTMGDHANQDDLAAAMALMQQHMQQLQQTIEAQEQAAQHQQEHLFLFPYLQDTLSLQVYTTPAQHLDSTWSSPLNTMSASATTSTITSGTTSVQTSYIFSLPLLALCADQAQHSSGSTTTFLTWNLSYQMYFSPPRDLHHTMLFSLIRYAFSRSEHHHSPPV